MIRNSIFKKLKFKRTSFTRRLVVRQLYTVIHMKKIVLLFFTILFLSLNSFGQNTTENVVYIVDSIPVIEDPEEGNEILEVDIADMTIVKNKDSLRVLGYEKLDGAIYIFTKEYRKRLDELKEIPSSRQMEKKNGVWYFRNAVYTGQFIDYYYSGRKEGEGIFKNGKVDGPRTRYYQNGKISTEGHYSDGIENGLEKEYYEDGSLKQKGDFKNGNEVGIWEKYFPNGQVKQKSSFKDGQMDGETTVYYSTGRVLATELVKNGKASPDKTHEKINQAMTKGHLESKEGDYKTALKSYSKVIEVDSTYAEAYFSRGTIKLNDFQFDDAISDFDKALTIEPYMAFALSNRAFARIRKYQFGSARTLSKNSEVTVLASKDKVIIPAQDKEKICLDLQRAILLGDKSKMIMDALGAYCK